jgi:hypothetical protein
MVIDLDNIELYDLIKGKEILELIFNKDVLSTKSERYALKELLSPIKDLELFIDIAERAIKSGNLKYEGLKSYYRNFENAEFRREIILLWLKSTKILNKLKRTNISDKFRKVVEDTISETVEPSLRQTINREEVRLEESGETAKKTLLDNNFESTAHLKNFITKLRISCENDIEIIIQAPNKPPITCNPDSLGFRNVNTNQWKDLISLLKSANGTYYYSSKDKAKRSVWREIEKKLRDFLNEKFNQDIPDDFKLFSPVKGEAGLRKPLFQITRLKDIVNDDFKNCNEKQITEKLKEFASYASEENAKLYIKATERAKELGMSDDTIKNVVDIDNLLGSLDNLDSNNPDRDQWGTTGKQILPEPDPYSPKD